MRDPTSSFNNPTSSFNNLAEQEMSSHHTAILIYNRTAVFKRAKATSKYWRKLEFCVRTQLTQIN